MTREIKFRVWDKAFKRMKVTGIGINNGVLDGDDVEIMQYTGLKDKNGKEIYEGDIVKGKGLDFYNPDVTRVVVEWLGCGSWYPFADNEDNMPYPYPEAEEVIGNIYENPELLEAVK